MSSRSQEAVTDASEMVTIDRRAVLETGTQVVDSIVYDTAPEAIRETMDALKAAWQTMVHGNALNLVEVLEMGQEVLNLADRSQIQMEGLARETLKNGMDQFEAMIRQGTFSVEVVENIAGKAIDANSDISRNALELVADVKTGDYADNLKTMTFAVMAFALLAMWMQKD